MRMKNRFFLISLFLLLNYKIFSQESDWILAAQKFTSTNQSEDVVYDSIASLLPKMILEKINNNNYRFIPSEELLQRELDKLKKEQSSLILQLSKEIQVRDSLFLGNYTKSGLKDKINDSKKEIDSIKEDLQTNLEAQKELEMELIAINEQIEVKKDTSSLSELDKYSALLKELILENENEEKIEKIVLYNNSSESLYNFSFESSLDDENYYQSRKVQDVLVASNINCLITGKLTFYDEFFLVTVDAYTYPGGKHIASCTESASIDEIDYVASVIARRLIPSFTNAMPVYVSLNSNIPNFQIFIDDVFYKDVESDILLDAGVHTIQFTAPGYKSVTLNYFFNGNKKYDIDIVFSNEDNKNISIKLDKAFTGDIFSNGFKISLENEKIPQILVNDKAVLGQAITKDGKNAFFYIPQKQIEDSDCVSLELETLDINDYIEKRRRRMYNSYSLLLISLIPTFVTYGQYSNYNNMTWGNLTSQELSNKKTWDISSKICIGLSVSCGIYFGYELVRYLMAANKILPEESKIVKDSKIEEKENENQLDLPVDHKEKIEGDKNINNEEIE